MRDENGRIDEVWSQYLPVTREELDLLCNDNSGIHWKNIAAVVGYGEMSIHAAPEHLTRMEQDVKYLIARVSDGDENVPAWSHAATMKGDLSIHEGLASLMSAYRTLVESANEQA